MLSTFFSNSVFDFEFPLPLENFSNLVQIECEHRNGAEPLGQTTNSPPTSFPCFCSQGDAWSIRHFVDFSKLGRFALGGGSGGLAPRLGHREHSSRYPGQVRLYNIILKTTQLTKIDKAPNRQNDSLPFCFNCASDSVELFTVCGPWENLFIRISSLVACVAVLCFCRNLIKLVNSC